MTPKEIREQRASVYGEIRKLADMVAEDKSKGQKAREFTAEEETRWKVVNADYDSLTKQLEVAERAAKLHAEQTTIVTDTETRGAGREDFNGDPSNQVDPNDNRAKPTAEDCNLAIQGWCRSQYGLALEDRHEAACKRVGLNPNSKEIRGNFLNNTQYRKLQNIKRSCRSGEEFETRAQSAIIESLGGFMVGQTMAGQIEMATLAYGGMMETSDVITTTGGEAFTFPYSNDTSNTGAQISENTTVSETTATGGGLTLTAHKFTSNVVKVPSELLEDSTFDVAGWITGNLGERVNRILNTKATTGVGATTFWGIVPASTVGKTTASATAIAADEWLDLIHSVDPSYRNLPGAGFMFHDNILLSVRKLKDGAGQYLWQPGLTNGAPDRLINYPYTINQDMQSSIATGMRTVVFGSLRHYKIRRAGQFRVFRLTERYRDADQDGFVVFARADGGLLDAGTHPVKCMLQA